MTAESRPEETTEETGQNGRDERAESEPEGSAGGLGDGEPVLHAEGLSKSFGDLEVLQDVSLSLASGTIGAIVGPNGSGKTTLLRALAGLSPHGGTVEVEAGGPRAVGYLPQSPAFRPRFTVQETLSFYADLLPGAVDVDATLDRVGMVGAVDRRTEALSGGMRRLLGIAQATLGDPPLVLLDEPTSDLDPRMTEHIFGVVEDIVDGGAAVLLATHDTRGVERSDRAFLLDRGRIVVSGTPDELRGDAASALEALFAEYVAAPTSELTVRTHDVGTRADEDARREGRHRTEGGDGDDAGGGARVGTGGTDDEGGAGP